MQSAGGPTARNRTCRVAVFQGAAKPPADRAGGAPGADRSAVAFEPHFAGGITGQIAAVVLAQQRTEVQGGRARLDIDVHHHGGVLAVRAADGFGVPAGLDQPQERLEVTGHRRRALRGVVMGLFPLGDQRLAVRGQRRLELRPLDMGQFDPPPRELLIARLTD